MHDQSRERRLQCLAPVVLSSGRGPIVRRPGRDSPSRTDHRVGNWGSVKGHFLDLPGLNSGSIRPSQRNMDTGVVSNVAGRPTLPLRLWPDAHGFSQSLDFGLLNLNASLPSSATLEVFDRVRLAANDELSAVRARQPVVQARDGNPEPLSSLLRGE